MTIDPEERGRQIAGRLHQYCTALIKLFLDDNGQPRLAQIGSGTFVRVGDIHGILTAYHCAELLSGEYLLGLSVAPEGREQNFTINPNSLSIVPIAKPVSEEFGPDLAFIGIADWDKIATIKASKSFYDLMFDRALMLEQPPENDSSAWYVCGVPNVTFLPTNSEAGFEHAFEFMELCGLGGIDRVFERNGYDYGEMHFPASEGDVPPESFGGMSGGGLWQVPWPPSSGSAESIPDMLLAGVIYYQGTTEEGLRFLRNHFRVSIYRHVVDALVS